MKLSFTTMATPDLNGEQAIQLAARLGFDGVDLRVSADRGELCLNTTLKEVRHLKKVAMEEQVALPCLLCYNPTELRTGWERNRFTALITDYLNLAGEIGAQSIRILPGQGNEEQLTVLADLIGQVAVEVAGTARILVQNHSKGWSFADTVHLIKTINLPRVRWFSSPEHGLLSGEEVEMQLCSNLDLIGGVFVADLIKTNGCFHDTLPGRGIVPWNDYLGLLRNFHYQHWISFKWEKVWREDLADADAALPAFLAFMKNWRTTL